MFNILEKKNRKENIFLENQDILKKRNKDKAELKMESFCDPWAKSFPRFPDSTVGSSNDLYVLKSTPNCHTVVCFLKFKEAELTQNLSPVGFGPSSNTWPMCELQSAHLASTRAIPTTKTNPSLSEPSCTIALYSLIPLYVYYTCTKECNFFYSLKKHSLWFVQNSYVNFLH